MAPQTQPGGSAAPLVVVRAPVGASDAARRCVRLRVDRLRLAKRRWRGTADDGVEFGFELERPLQPGDVFHRTDGTEYVIDQDPEAVLDIALALAPCAAAAIGWAMGNLHLELSSEPHRLLTPDDPAARQLLERIGISYTITEAVFRPGRFSRGATGSGEEPAGQELGPSHRH